MFQIVFKSGLKNSKQRNLKAVPLDRAREPMEQAPLICSEVNLIRCLGAAGINVLTGTDDVGNNAIYSRYSKNWTFFSPYDSKEFIEELCELGKTLNYKPVIMSYDDRLILNISRYREKLSDYYQFLLPEKEMVEKLLDKIKFIELSKDYDLPVPKSVNILKPDDIRKVKGKLQKPYLIKPVYRHDWFDKNFTKIVGPYKKAYVCKSYQELKKLHTRITQINPKMVIQEYVEGADDSLFDVNMYIDASGNIRGRISCHKLRLFPPNTGHGTCSVTVDDQELLDLSEQVAKQLQLKGLVNIQYKKEAGTLEPKIIEIHARSSTYDVLGIKANMNLPALYHADLSGNPISVGGKARVGVKYINLQREIRLLLYNRKSTSLTQTIYKLAKSYLGYTRFIQGLSISDPKPMIMNFFGETRKALGILKQKIE